MSTRPDNDLLSPSSHSAIPPSDLEVARLHQDNFEAAAHYALNQVGSFLNQADNKLCQLTDQPEVLGSAIVRGCQDLADVIGQLADQIDNQTLEDRRELAQACIEDSQLLLQDSNNQSSELSQTSTDTGLLTNFSQNDIVSAIGAAGSLLREIETTLRSIERNEADEIADAALMVAHIFVSSLQSFHATVRPEDWIANSENASRQGLKIEMLDDDEEEGTFENINGRTKKSPTIKNKDYRSSKSSNKNHQRRDRLRVLWPPIGPAVNTTLQWGCDAATKQPLLAAALGLVLWPTALVTALVATPAVLADNCIQYVYNTSQDAPLIQTVERSAAQLYQTSRLTFLCGKLMGRQTIRIVFRQIKQHGGPGKIAQQLAGIAIDRVTHPIETVHMAWKGCTWGIGQVYNEFKAMQARMEETDEAALRLQQ